MNEIKKDIAELKLQDLDMVSGGCTSANDMRTCPVCGRSVDAADFVNHIRSSNPEFVSNLEEILRAMDQLNQQELENEKSIVES